MKNLWKLIRFELRYHLRRPATWGFAALLLGQGAWYGLQAASNNLARQYYINSAASVYFVLASLGVGLAVVGVLLAGQSLTKDMDHRTAPYLYALPINGQSLFIGRLLGTYLTVLALAIFELIGLAVAPFFLPGRVGPVPLLALGQAFLELTVLQVFTLVSIAYSLTVLLRGIRGAYLTLFAVVLYFLLTEAPRSSAVPPNDLLLLLDPFGVGMIREAVGAMEAGDKNAGSLPLSDMLLINRILWLAFPLALLQRAIQRFSFTWFESGHVPSQSAITQPTGPVTERSSAPAQFPAPTHQPSGIGSLRRLARLTRQEFADLTRQPLVQVFTGLLVVLALLFATVFNQNADFDSLPTTARMVAIRHPISILTGLFVLILTGELIHRERTVGLWLIFDALPQPAAIRLLPKLLALMAVAALLMSILFGIGLAVQLISPLPAADIGWRLYGQALIIDGWWPLCQLITLGALVSALVNQRVAGHLVATGLFVGLWVTHTVQDGWLLFSFLPGKRAYSDLTGYGSWEPIRTMISYVWWCAAGLFVVLALLVWQRGTSVTTRQRLSEARRRFSGGYVPASVGLSILLGLSLFGLNRVGYVPEPTTNSLPSTVIVERQAVPVGFQTKQTIYHSVSGKTVSVSVVYQHTYQADKFLSTTLTALQTGEQLFGPYPFPALQLTEIPRTVTDSVQSAPGQVAISEDGGWIARTDHPDQLDYLDYLITREVLSQWLVHGLPEGRTQPANGLTTTGLTEYLALQTVGHRYGHERLRQRLHQRAERYATQATQYEGTEPTLVQATGPSFVSRDRAALVLTSLGQVMGDSALRQAIGRFYRQAVGAKQQRTSAAFVQSLRQQLPDSLQYLTTYLDHRYQFSLCLGRVVRTPTTLTVQVLASKTNDDGLGHKTDVLIDDLVPIVLYDRAGCEVFRKLVRPAPDQDLFQLPLLDEASLVVVDPLGTWPGTDPHKTRKVF